MKKIHKKKHTVLYINRTYSKLSQLTSYTISLKYFMDFFFLQLKKKNEFEILNFFLLSSIAI